MLIKQQNIQILTALECTALSSTFNTTTEVSLSKAPNPQLFCFWSHLANLREMKKTEIVYFDEMNI